MSNVEKQISKARRAPMAESKMVELLQKLRKNATGTLTFGKLVLVLDLLGWTVEPILGWTPRHYHFMKKDQLVDASTSKMSLKDLEKLQAHLLSVEVGRLPDAPSSLGETVVMEVGDIQRGGMDSKNPIYYFYRKEWVGTEGICIGGEQGFLLDHHGLERGLSLTDDPSAVSDIWNWLKTVGIQESISKALGTEVHVPAAERTRENTGTCAVCWGNYKLTDGKLVLHGYERPGYGFLQGSCFGVDSPALELSNECARSYRGLLKSNLDIERKILSRLKSGETDVLYDSRIMKAFEPAEVKRGDPGFDSLLRKQIEKKERLVEQLTADIDLYSQIVNDWHTRPMPKDGEMKRGPRFFLKGMS